MLASWGLAIQETCDEGVKVDFFFFDNKGTRLCPSMAIPGATALISFCKRPVVFYWKIDWTPPKN